jgi:glycosyltransferase involved in cell wall biosynthesis
MRILHAPSNIANQAWYAAQGLRALGYDVEVWEYGDARFGFPADRLIDTSARDENVIWEHFLEAIERFDVFHFHFARSLIPTWVRVPFLWDVPMLRLLGKKIFFTFHGAECTVRRIHEQTNPWSYFRYSDLDADDDLILKRIHLIRTYADEMFVVSTEYFPFVPDARWVPRIIDLSEWPAQEPEIRSRPRVLHIPSRRGKKGTEMILSGLERLRGEGLEFDLALVEGVSHEEAKKQIRSADIVVDNILTGDYEVVSMETMASSRVAVANVSDEVVEAYGGDIPVHNVNPETFVDRMRALISDREACLEVASRGRRHVARHHDAPVIAGLLAERYAAAEPKTPRRAHPDWYASGGARTIELLEEKIATLSTDRTRLIKINARLQERIARLDRRERALHAVKQRVPAPVRKRLQSLRWQIARRSASRKPNE